MALLAREALGAMRQVAEVHLATLASPDVAEDPRTSLVRRALPPRPPWGGVHDTTLPDCTPGRQQPSPGRCSAALIRRKRARMPLTRFALLRQGTV